MSAEIFSEIFFDIVIFRLCVERAARIELYWYKTYTHQETSWSLSDILLRLKF